MFLRLGASRRPVWRQNRWDQAGMWLNRVRLRVTPRSLTVVTGAILLALFVARQINHDNIDIDAISVPKDLEEEGFTPTVVASLVSDRLNDMSVVTQSRSQIDRVRSLLVGSSTDLESIPNVELAGTKLGTTAIVEIVRSIFGITPWHVSGEIALRPNPNQRFELETSLTLRISRGNDRGEPVVLFLPNDPDVIAARSAEVIVGRINPYALASYYYRNRRLDETIEEVQQIIHDREIDEKPDRRLLAAAYNLWGLALARREHEGDLEQARQKFSLATEYRPDYAEAYANAGWVLQLEKSFPESISMFQKAAKFDRSAEMYTNWAASLDSFGQRPEAKRKLIAATELDPSFPGSFENLGNILASEGDYTEAEKNYRRAIVLYQRPGGGYSYRFPQSEINSMLEGVYVELSEELEKSGKHEEAQEFRKKAGDLAPKP
jgi:tetratricopeptide (TPR) repeat protein